VELCAGSIQLAKTTNNKTGKTMTTKTSPPGYAHDRIEYQLLSTSAGAIDRGI